MPKPNATTKTATGKTRGRPRINHDADTPPVAAEAPAARKKTSREQDEILRNLQFDQEGRASLAHLLKQEPNDIAFKIWIVGTTPLITHAWSQKAKTEMLSKQVKSVRGGRAERKPEEDFQSSLYEFPGDTPRDRRFGFPAMGVKNAVLAVAHKDKGIAKTSLMSALWLDADIVSVRPAHAGAICDMPLLRIYGDDPQMREDMVRVGAMVKTATLAYRAQFTNWAMRITGRINTDVVSLVQFVTLIRDAGVSSGLGEWRNERRGVFGAFRMATAAEMGAWDRFADGKGKMPEQKTRSDPVSLAA